ncbi:hypothetical protein Pmani_002881 [Petrolisthes manimaculis]|uniref:Uncharacterized protein n=1 Tax=Petrolisthes manimaculis TaxID=1843537 RepID=A0AAE1UQK7_9EUCA|nr:hypothetical protein Pmani_002881 [Petrolisthes manimaculis]
MRKVKKWIYETDEEVDMRHVRRARSSEGEMMRCGRERGGYEEPLHIISLKGGAQEEEDEEGGGPAAGSDYGIPPVPASKDWLGSGGVRCNGEE